MTERRRDERITKGKKAYRKPVLVEIALRPGEAVLGSCKVLVSEGPAAANCHTLSCSSDGS